MYSRFRLVPSPLCFCGEAEQTAQHVLQDCRGLQQPRDNFWTSSTTLQEKLYGTRDELQRTASFIVEANLTV